MEQSISVLNGLEFASLGSGSRGNSTLVRSASTTLLLDCGFSARKTVQLLAERDVQPEHLAGVLVTHEHGDHGRGAKRFCETFGISAYASRGTARSLSLRDDLLVPVESGDRFEIGDVVVQATSVPHDTIEPLQFVFSNGGYRLGILTDCGHIAPGMIEAYSKCNSIFLESNHDRSMLELGAYPPMTKQRIGGPYGHLSNGQSIEFLKEIMHEGLKTVVIGHISENNNDMEIVKGVFAEIENQCKVVLATQDTGTKWLH